MRHSLISASYSSASAASENPTPGLVIGSGGTARAAIYALHALSHSPIYIVARTHSKLPPLISSFPEDYNLIPLTSISAAEALITPPAVAIGTVPASSPLESEMREILATLLRHEKFDKETKRTLLEMAYKPNETPLMRMAEDAGWNAIPGLEVLSAQGWYQFQKWTDIKPLYADARAAVMGDDT